MNEETIELDTETLAGDVRSAILDKIRGTNMSWSMMTEQQQRDFAREIDQLAKYLVREAVNLVAANGVPVIRARCGDVKKNAKDGHIEAKVSMSGTDEQRHQLIDAAGFPVLIVIADHEQYSGEREPVRIDPDQPEMIDAELHIVRD